MRITIHLRFLGALILAGLIAVSPLWAQDDDIPPEATPPVSDTPAQDRLERIRGEMTARLARLDASAHELSGTTTRFARSPAGATRWKCHAARGSEPIQAAAETDNRDATLRRSLDLLEAISRRAAYLALLQQYPQALQKLVQLVSSSSWAADYLQRHPILLDELLDPRLLEAGNDWEEFRSTLAAR